MHFRSLQPLKPYLNEIFEQFYQKLLKHPRFSSFFKNQEAVQKVIYMQKQNFIASLEDDSQAFEMRFKKIGEIHYDVCLPYVDFLKGNQVLKDILVDITLHNLKSPGVIKEIYEYIFASQTYMSKGYLKRYLAVDKEDINNFIVKYHAINFEEEHVVKLQMAWLLQLLDAIEKEDIHLAPELDVELCPLYTGLVHFFERNKKYIWLEKEHLYNIHKRIHIDAQNIFYLLAENDYSEILPLYTSLLSVYKMTLILTNTFSYSELLKVKEEALQYTQEKLFLYKEMIAKAEEAIFLTDMKTKKIIDANQKACEKTLHTKEELLQKQITDICFPYTELSLEVYFEQLIQEKNLLLYARQLRKDNKFFPVEATVNLLETNEEQYLVSFVRDITTRLENEEKLLQSEERFKLLSNVAFEGIVLSDEGIIFECNQTILDISGYQREAIIGKSLIDFVPKDLKPMIAEKVRGDSEETYEILIYCKNNQQIPVEVRTKMIPYGKKMVRVSALRDISDKKAFQQELEKRVELEVNNRLKEEKKYQILFDTTNDAILVHNISADGKPSSFIAANKKAETLFDYSQQEFFTLTFIDLHPPGVFAEIESKFQSLLQNKNLMLLLPFYKKDKTIFWAELNVTLFEMDSMPTVIGSIRDVTKRVLLEQEKKQREQLLIQQSRLAAMGEMVGAIAHQWRQPLTSLGGVLINIQDMYDFGELDQEKLATLIHEGENLLEYMSRTIDDFRNFFKPAKEKIVFNVLQLVIQALQILSAQLKNSYIDYSLYYIDDKKQKQLWQDLAILPETVVIKGYPNEFQQVLVNIINNAKDAIVERIAQKIITQGYIIITIVKEDSHIKISIQDNGGGIPESIFAKIFDPYFTTKPEGKGTGIGLYMAKMIIENNMQGKILVKNIENGCQFTLILPVFVSK